jgi:high mobility group protein B3
VCIYPHCYCFHYITFQPTDLQLPEYHGEDNLTEDDDAGKKRKKNQRDGSSLRKCPTAPKRFKSSYICFFMAKQPVIKEELGDSATVSEVSKRSADMWRSLSAEDRAHWDEVAAKDKQRYMVEKATYTGPWQVPWKRAKKDPSAPKRPMSAFLYYSQDKRRAIKDANPSLKNTEVSRILGDLWRNATDEDKKPHVDRELLEREKYKVSIADWREEYEKKVEDQKKQQAEQAAYSASMYGQDPAAGAATQPTPYPLHNPYDPNTMHPQYTNPPYGYAMPPNYAYGYPPPHQPIPYGYANGKHVAVLGPNGMPAAYYTPQQNFAVEGQQEGYANTTNGLADGEQQVKEDQQQEGQAAAE